MSEVVGLADAQEDSRFGAKATGLGAAVRNGLPIPPGIALSGSFVDEVAVGNELAIELLVTAAQSLVGPLAVRSSAADEDGADASFAGQHLTLLNVPSVDDLSAAVREIWWSANSDSAITYRQRVGLFARPSIGVVVQSLLDPDVAGVMFTQNPINKADERLIEASWGLGEVVVAGRVIPDSFRMDRAGTVLERTPGVKKIAIRAAADGGTVEETVAPELVEQLCLDDGQLAQLSALAEQCDEVYGPARDIEWAFAGGQLYLLQCRAVTRAGSSSRPTTPPVGSEQVEAIERVPFFANMSPRDVEGIAALFKERRFAAGETVTKEGAGGAAFFVIESGEASVSVGGRVRAKLTKGDYFGEIALIDEGARSATITASSELVCYGLTYWEFRPLVQQNATIAWNLLQTLAKRLRTAQDDQPA
ncbi:MAG: Phosphoenolpyruvate synthase/pyruvate phosphate dikinase [Actinomycetia bacterium]|nr:Phosphoenolpyruvate synthase/pyruvate phosphate dikinase [Actinomycetes bacterium]